MDDAITLSSGSEKSDSDVEIVGAYKVNQNDPKHDKDVRVKLVDIALPKHFIDLTDGRWASPKMRRHRSLKSTASNMIDLTDSDLTDWTEQNTKTLTPKECHRKRENTNKTLKKQGFNSRKHSSGGTTIVSPIQDCDVLKTKKRLRMKNQQKTNKISHFEFTPAVKLEQLPLFDRSQDMSPKVWEQQENKKECAETELPVNDKLSNPQQNPDDSPTLDERNAVEISKEHIKCEAEKDNFCSSTLIHSQASHTSCHDKAQGSCQRELCCSRFSSPVLDSRTKQLELDQVEYNQSHSPSWSFSRSPTNGQDLPQTLDINSQSHINLDSKKGLLSEAKSTSAFQDTQNNNTSVRLVEEVDMVYNSLECMGSSTRRDSPMSLCSDEDAGEGAVWADLRTDSPVSFLWEPVREEDEVNKESRFDVDVRGASLEDRCFVCPITLRKIMDGPPQALNEDSDGAAEVLCRQSLRQAYCTIDESYPEGTLEVLADLLQPRYYPPKDITSHLLRGILLDPQCPQHLCVQAFNLLMRTQRHHMVDKTTVPWDWELLTSVMADQDQAKQHRHEVVCLFLEYVVQTLEDDFQAKRALAAHHHSIAKEILSCDLQFSRIRDIIKWLFDAIMKSTENGECGKIAKERDEHIRMVLVFQRMLALAVEVDRSPTISSAKLSHELFLTILSSVLLRAHRMLLLQSLQSNLIRCKLLEHLLDFACPLKTTLPMSLSLLLHFLKNCTLTLDPMDGTERWQRWEELVHLLWMLMFSYNKVMKGYQCSSVTEQRARVSTLVYKPDDKISRDTVYGAVQAFLSRSQADVGQALPLHVDQSLSDLRDYLLDVCQC